MDFKPTTLGSKPAPATVMKISLQTKLINTSYTVLNIIIFTIISTLPLWWALMHPSIKIGLIFFFALLISAWLFVARNTTYPPFSS